MHPAPQPERSSKKMIIILAIIGVLILLIGGLVVAAAVGIFIYTSGATTPERDYDPPRPTSSRTPASTTTNTGTSTGGNKTDALIEAVKQKTPVGGYSLQNVIPQHSSRAFTNSLGEVKGVYTANGNTVSFVVSEIENRGRASVEFGRMLGRERARGAKVTEQIRVKGSTINAAFENGKTKSVAFCNWTDKAPVLCHVVSSDEEKALTEFREGLASGR